MITIKEIWTQYSKRIIGGAIAILTSSLWPIYTWIDDKRIEYHNLQMEFADLKEEFEKHDFTAMDDNDEEIEEVKVDVDHALNDGHNNENAIAALQGQMQIVLGRLGFVITTVETVQHNQNTAIRRDSVSKAINHVQGRTANRIE